MILGVNGRFLGARPTGVQRFAAEIVRRLWGGAEESLLFLPRGVRPPTDLPAGVRPIRGRLGGQAWERLELPRAAGAAGCQVVLNPANTLPASGGPHVVVVHDVEPFLHPEAFAPGFRTWYRYGVAPAVRGAARVVTGSRASADDLATVLGVDPARIRIAAQGPDPFVAPASAAEVGEVRRRLALAGPYLLAVGGSDPRKNVDFLGVVVASWRSRRARGERLPPPPALVVVSGGDARVFTAAGRARARAAGELRIGRVDDQALCALYTGAAALAFPSLSEGFGRPPLEALACGTPVVTAPYRTAGEVLGDAAERVPLEPDAWVDALAALLEETPAAAAARSARGRAHAARHSWDAGAETVLSACREAAGATASSAASVSRPVPVRVGPAAAASGYVPARVPPPPFADLRVALVHDWLTGMRGGEKVLEALLELFPRADLFTLLHVPGTTSAAIEARRIESSFVQRLPAAARRYRGYLPLFPRAVESFDLAGYDLVVSSSHCVAKGAVPPPGAPHLCYCHTPMRYVWDQFDAYFGRGRAGWPTRAAAAALAPGLRRWDRASARRVDRFVANSAHVRDRIGRFYARDAAVVHPPVDVERFRPAREREDFYLVLSALVPYKKVDVAVRALDALDRPLVVVGSGPERARLEALAGPRTRFSGWLSDPEVADLLGRCRALLMPGVEDFGIAPVEAQAAGAPVIALAAGGALETVVGGDGAGATGVLFERPAPEALAAAVRAFEARSFDVAALRRNAERFGRERFLDRMRIEVEGVLAGPRPARPRLALSGEPATP